MRSPSTTMQKNPVHLCQPQTHTTPNAPTVRRQHAPTNHVAIVVVVATNTEVSRSRHNLNRPHHRNDGLHNARRRLPSVNFRPRPRHPSLAGPTAAPAASIMAGARTFFGRNSRRMQPAARPGPKYAVLTAPARRVDASAVARGLLVRLVNRRII